MSKRIFVLMAILLITLSFTDKKYNSVRDYFKVKNWNYPIHYDFPKVIPFYDGCGMGYNENEYKKFVNIDSLRAHSKNYYAQLKSFYTNLMKKGKIHKGIGKLITDVHFCVIDSLGETHLFITDKEFYYCKNRQGPDIPLVGDTTKAKGNIYIDFSEKEDESIYSISEGAIFKINKDYSLTYFDWWN